MIAICGEYVMVEFDDNYKHKVCLGFEPKYLQSCYVKENGKINWKKSYEAGK